MAFYVDDVKVGGVRELCKFLSIPAVQVPFLRKIKEFEQIMERDARGNPKRDRDGNYEVKRKIAGVPSFSVYVPGKSEVRVRYAQTQRLRKDEAPAYTPTMLTMDPAEDGTAIFNNEEEFTFWFLNPMNASSPFHQDGTKAYYEYKDNDTRSKIENDTDAARVDALAMIVGRNSLSPSKLRMIAKGLGITGVDDMTDDVMRKSLRDIANADPVSFVNKVDSREIVFGGKIQDAIDKKVIELRSVNNMQRWYLNDKEIVPVAYGTDPQTVLKDELSTNYHLYADELEASLTNATVSNNLNNPAFDKYFDRPAEVVETQVPAAPKEELPDLTDEQKGYLEKMRTEEWYDTKIKKYAAMDPANITHPTQKKAYNESIPAIEAYKLQQRLLEAEPVE